MPQDNAHVRTLNIASNGISDDGAAAMAVTLQLTKYLRNLDVSDNGVGNSGGMKIADSLSRNASLTGKLLITKNSLSFKVKCLLHWNALYKHARTGERRGAGGSVVADGNNTISSASPATSNHRLKADRSPRRVIAATACAMAARS